MTTSKPIECSESVAIPSHLRRRRLQFCSRVASASLDVILMRPKVRRVMGCVTCFIHTINKFSLYIIYSLRHAAGHQLEPALAGSLMMLINSQTVD